MPSLTAEKCYKMSVFMRLFFVSLKNYVSTPTKPIKFPPILPNQPNVKRDACKRTLSWYFVLGNFLLFVHDALNKTLHK